MTAAGGGGRRKRCRLLRSGSRSQVPLVVVAYVVGILGFQLNVIWGKKRHQHSSISSTHADP